MNPDAEAARLARAKAAIPSVAGRYDDVLDAPAAERGPWLWSRAVADAHAGDLDDRPLYWARLGMLAANPRDTALERRSRGFQVEFPAGEPGVLLTGFDPFHLDQDIRQSNPSGVAALALHGTRIAGANVRSAILPVRYADFDRGIVEQLLTPIFAGACGPLTLALTISMGRDRFDLERFPGRRRSSTKPDNQRQLADGTEQCPLPPRRLEGPEFLEFSLPVEAMAAAPGPWPVLDNRRVETLERGAISAAGLTELASCTAVAGSGGGFLSNEVSYRSLLLRARLGGDFALGHLHTPAVTGHDAPAQKDMVAQIRRIVAAAVGALHPA